MTDTYRDNCLEITIYGQHLSEKNCLQCYQEEFNDIQQRQLLYFQVKPENDINLQQIPEDEEEEQKENVQQQEPEKVIQKVEIQKVAQQEKPKDQKIEFDFEKFKQNFKKQNNYKEQKPQQNKLQQDSNDQNDDQLSINSDQIEQLRDLGLMQDYQAKISLKYRNCKCCRGNVWGCKCCDLQECCDCYYYKKFEK